MNPFSARQLILTSAGFFFGGGLISVVGSEPLRFSQSLRCPESTFFAVVEEVDYDSGFLTSAADRIRITDKPYSDSSGTVVFLADAAALSEKPTMKWQDRKLFISYSRDVYIMFKKPDVGGFSVEFIRRDELKGIKPIGSLLSALHDSNRIWTRDDLTAKIWQTVTIGNKVSDNSEITEWVDLFNDKQKILVDDTLNSEISVREVALTCLAELLKNKSILEKLEDREMLATGAGGKPARYYIKIVNDKNVPEIIKKLNMVNETAGR